MKEIQKKAEITEGNKELKEKVIRGSLEEGSRDKRAIEEEEEESDSAFDRAV